MNQPQPWICPRCATVNAPHVNQCVCRPQQGIRPPLPLKKYWVGDPPWGTGTITNPPNSSITVTLADNTRTVPIQLGGYTIPAEGN